MKKQIKIIQTIATGSAHSFGEGFEKGSTTESNNEEIFTFVKKRKRK